MTRKVRSARWYAKTTITSIIINAAVFGGALYTLVIQGLIKNSLDTIDVFIYTGLMLWMFLAMISNVWKLFKKFDVSYKEKAGFFYE